jgi:hypothetical protein
MKKAIVALFILITSQSIAQQIKFYTTNADSTKFALTTEGASHLAQLPMKCIVQEYPNKVNHTAVADEDQKLTPIQLHPSFYGCFDWHSSVHGHWMLVRLLKQFPNLKEAQAIRKLLNTTLSAENIKKETAYFNAPLSKSFERTYGWAWILKLQEEINSYNDAEATQWKQNLQPLTNKVIELWIAFLPKQTYPNRTGVHGNTAFGLNFAIDYARSVHNDVFEKQLIKAANRLFLQDKNAPTLWEPDGSDFFSPSLMEADLMRKVLPKSQFTNWLNHWLSNSALQHLTQLPHVSDRSDLQIVHLDGLCFSRSWCMSGIAQQLPINDTRRKLLLASSVKHLNQSLSTVASGEYGGEHWLASFAVYAISGGK